MQKHMDKTEHYDHMRNVLSKISSGEFGQDTRKIMQAAADALSAENVNENGQTFNQFLLAVEEIIGTEPSPGAWTEYWSDDMTPEEAAREDGQHA